MAEKASVKHCSSKEGEIFFCPLCDAFGSLLLELNPPFQNPGSTTAASARVR